MKGKLISYTLTMLFAGILYSSNSSAQQETDRTIGDIATQESLKPVRPGEPGGTPFWNTYADRFIYAPAFEMPEVAGASKYKFTINIKDGKSLNFTAEKPWAALSPVWDKEPEGYATVIIEGLDDAGNTLGQSGQKSFYKSPVFPGSVNTPSLSYHMAGQKGLKALFDAQNVQYWLTHNKPDPDYRLYSYPNKVMGGLIRAMTAYSKVATDKNDRSAALKIAKRTADYLLSVRTPAGSVYSFVPPTYLSNVDQPYPQAIERAEKKWFMVPSAIDAAFGFLDLYDAENEAKYLDAAKKIAQTLKSTQRADGTWPLMVNSETGKSVHEQDLIPTWIIFFFDRLEQQYKITEYRDARNRAWNWIVKNPLNTYQWNGQFEDVKLRGPYRNLAREQACDVAMLLLDDAGNNPENIAQADELLRFAEDQFVVWSEVKDPDSWSKAMPSRLETTQLWITPCVLEQYECYEPVARSSAILINTYIKAYQITKNPIYLAKAKGIANGLLAGQAYMIKTYNITGEIPTWILRRKPSNWLNNSFYAAESLLKMAAAVHAR